MRADGLQNAASYTMERMLEQCEALYREVMEEAPMLGASIPG